MIAFLGYVSALFIAALAVLIVTNVTMRTAGQGAISVLVQLSETLMVGVVFLALAVAERDNTHVRMELVTARLPMRAASVARTVAMLGSAGITGIFAYYTSIAFWESLSVRERRFGIVDFPVWPARLLIAVGFTLIAIEYLVKAWAYGRAAWRAPEGDRGARDRAPSVVDEVAF